MSKTLTRHDFLTVGGSFLFAPFAGTVFASDERPLFRMGVMTDTHVGPTAGSCSLVKAALELFKAKGVDMVVNNWDIADRFYPSSYGILRQLYNSVFPGTSWSQTASAVRTRCRCRTPSGPTE